MNMEEIKIGSKIKIINSGYCYSSYKLWMKKTLVNI